jgi:OFA family oxalate/formate antiporter-like MFS transporter
MAQEVIKMTPLEAASMVGIIGLLNGAGRIGWSTISDYIGRLNTYIAFFVIEIAAFYMLASVTDSFFFQALIFIIITCYGGGFSCMPAYLSDIFGTQQLSAIYGRILTAWGLAGIVGPLLLSVIYEQTNSYGLTLYFFSGCFVVSLIVCLILKIKGKK